MSEEKEEEKKENIKNVLSLIPPASALKGEKKELKEKRVKLRKKPEVDKGVIIVPEKTAKELGIKDEVEVSVKGRRHVFKAITLDKIPEYEVWGNPEDLAVMGLEDNSTVTIRARATPSERK